MSKLHINIKQYLFYICTFLNFILGLSDRHSLSLSSLYMGVGLVVYAKVIALLQSSLNPG